IHVELGERGLVVEVRIHGVAALAGLVQHAEVELVRPPVLVAAGSATRLRLRCVDGRVLALARALGVGLFDHVLWLGHVAPLPRRCGGAPCPGLAATGGPVSAIVPMGSITPTCGDRTPVRLRSLTWASTTQASPGPS